MRLAVDGREIQNGVYTGIGRALYNFLHHFSRSLYNDRCVVFSSKPLPFKFDDKIVNHVMEEDSTFFWDQVQLTLAIKQMNVEFFYSPYYKIPLLAGCYKVSSVLDIMYLKYPPYAEGLTSGERFYYNWFGRRYLRSSDRIITCSQFSKEEIVEYYGVDRKKIEVIPLSVASFYRPELDQSKIDSVKRLFGIIRPYILYVGNFKHHKNVVTLIKAFLRISNKFPDMFLVLAGPKDATYPELIQEILKVGLGTRVIFTDKIADEETMRLLYAGASLFVMPSLYEGFGLPPVEAMACGVPVVCSNATSLIEVAQGAAHMVNPLNVEEMAMGMDQVLTDDVYRSDLVLKGRRRVVDFEESRTAGRLYDFFRSMMRS